jgi:hypothetical protein
MFPPTACTARLAASLKRRLFSSASFSLLALVLLLPLGATPVRIFMLSLGVKLTKSTTALALPRSAVAGGGPDLGVLGVRGLRDSAAAVDDACSPSRRRCDEAERRLATWNWAEPERGDGEGEDAWRDLRGERDCGGASDGGRCREEGDE